MHAADSMTACPCLNGGTFTGDACVCPTGYGGLYCEVDNTGGYQNLINDRSIVCLSHRVDCKCVISLEHAVGLVLRHTGLFLRWVYHNVCMLRSNTHTISMVCCIMLIH